MSGMALACIDLPRGPRTGTRVPRRTVGAVERPGNGDAMLLARLVAGDDSALRRLFDEHAGLVLGLARRVTGNEALAAEVVQDVFAYVWRCPDRVDLRRGGLRAYIGMLAYRRAVDVVRSVTRQRERDEQAARSAAPTVDDIGAEVTEAGAAAWRAARLRAALESLPAEQRDALTIAYFDGCTARELASRLGIPEGTAKSRLRLGLAKLRAALEVQLVEG